MKYILFLIVILISTPIFAACPIDVHDGSTCVAEFQDTTTIPDLMQPTQISPPPAMPSGNFTATPATVFSGRDYEAKKELRNFRSTEQDYGYNSSCQFGVCLDTGTPQTFSGGKN